MPDTQQNTEEVERAFATCVLVVATLISRPSTLEDAVEDVAGHGRAIEKQEQDVRIVLLWLKAVCY
jgi:hemoglobin-like flavoprotein